MPKLNQFIGVGFCAGYGDGDYRVSTEIMDMPRERFNELKLATLSALRCAEDMWQRSQQDTAQQAAKQMSDKCGHPNIVKNMEDGTIVCEKCGATAPEPI